MCPTDKGWWLEETNAGKMCFRQIIECLEVHGRCLYFSFLSGTFEQRSGLVGLCFCTSTGHWEALMPKAMPCRSSSLRRLQSALELLWMSLCECFERGAIFSRSVFLFGGFGEMQTFWLFSFLSSAVSGGWWDPGRKFKGWSDSRGPDNRLPGGSKFPVTFLTCFLVFKIITCPFLGSWGILRLTNFTQGTQCKLVFYRKLGRSGSSFLTHRKRLFLTNI